MSSFHYEYINVVDDELKIEDGKNVFFDRTYMRHKMNRISSSKGRNL